MNYFIQCGIRKVRLPTYVHDTVMNKPDELFYTVWYQ